MKKLFYLIIVMLVLGLLLPAAAVADETQSPSASTSEGMMFAATVMPLDGSWVILDEIMTAPAFFPGGPWTWDSDLPVEFTITDLYVVTDIFKVYDWGSFVIETPYEPDWDVLGLGGPLVSPPYTVDPDTALAEVRFSSAVICFASGLHSITIKDIHIPPTGENGAFIDGTVAFKAEILREWPIDIKPGSDPNSINIKRTTGVVAVAVLGTAAFDVMEIDVATLRFGPDLAVAAHDLTDPIVYADHLEDVNEDGFMDLVSHYVVGDIGLARGDTEACLIGETLSGIPIEGCDSVRILGKP